MSADRDQASAEQEPGDAMPQKLMRIERLYFGSESRQLQCLMPPDVLF